MLLFALNQIDYRINQSVAGEKD